jgi:hypothetical protein
MAVVWPVVIVIARAAILVYVGLGMVLFLTERRTVYLPEYPGPSVFEHCTAFGAGAENVVYEGMRMHHKRVSDRVVVFYHGNAGSACDRAILAPTFERAGYSFAFVEYPGYAGDVEGPSKKGIAQWHSLAKASASASPRITHRSQIPIASSSLARTTNSQISPDGSDTSIPCAFSCVRTTHRASG